MKDNYNSVCILCKICKIILGNHTSRPGHYESFLVHHSCILSVYCPDPFSSHRRDRGKPHHHFIKISWLRCGKHSDTSDEKCCRCFHLCYQQSTVSEITVNHLAFKDNNFKLRTWARLPTLLPETSSLLSQVSKFKTWEVSLPTFPNISLHKSYS